MGFGRIDLSDNIASQYEALKVHLGKLSRFKTASPDFQPGRRVIMRTGAFPSIDETCWSCASGNAGDKTKIGGVSQSALPIARVAIHRQRRGDHDMGEHAGVD